MPAPKLILINLAAADWRFLHPLIDAGAMPNIERMISAGVMGNLFSSRPLSRPTLDATLATGQRPDAHGILHELAPAEGGLGFRRTDGSDWAVPTLWDIVAARGGSAATVGWPATHPAQSFGGLVVSDRFCEARGKTYDDWPFDPETINNPDVAAELSDLRLHPSDVTGDMLRPFMPEGQELDFETDDRPAIFADCLARASTLHAAATWIGAHRSPDLLTVHFDFLAVLKSQFVQFRAPRMGHVTETDFERYAHVVNGAYQFADMMLGRYLDLAGSQGQVMVISGHGFLDGAVRPAPQPRGQGANGARHYRELGVLVASGPGFTPDTLSFGVQDIDIVPSALAALGLPSEPGLAGKVVPGMDASRQAAPSATDLPQRLGSADFGGLRIKQLVELEILRKPINDADLAREQIGVIQKMCLVETLMMQRAFSAALEVCEAVLSQDPGHVQSAMRQLSCLVELGRHDDARTVITELRASGVNAGEIALLEAKVEAAAGRDDRVQDLLAQAEKATGSGASKLRLLENVGLFHLERKEDEDAARVLFGALAIDPSSASAHGSLGRLYLRQKVFAKAVSHLKASLAKLQQQPMTHMRLGDAYMGLGQYAEAEQAYETVQSMAPDLKIARERRARAVLKRQAASV